jgi:hypothetical protein
MDKNLDHDPNKHQYENNHDNNISRGPNDSHRPQLSSEVPGQGQLSQGCQDMGEGDGNGGSDMNFGGLYSAMHQESYFDYDNVSEDGAEPIGQEGVEGNQLSPSECECPCHLKMTSDGRLVKEPCNVSYPGRHSDASSMVVGQGSNGEQSPDNSMIWGPRSSTPSEYSVFMGEMFPNEVFQRTPTVPNITHSFLSLIPELSFARNVELPLYYPMTLSMHEDSENEDDM